MLCPCWLGVKELMIMDQGYCAAPILFRIQNGNVDGNDLKGRDIVVLFDWPGPTILDGNATSRLYIDEAADEGQRKKLEAIFQGKRGWSYGNDILTHIKMAAYSEHQDRN